MVTPRTSITEEGQTPFPCAHIYHPTFLELPRQLVHLLSCKTNRQWGQWTQQSSLRSLATVWQPILFYRPETCTATTAVWTSLRYSPDYVTSSPAGSWWHNWGTEFQSPVNTCQLGWQPGGPSCRSAAASRDSRNYEHAVCINNISFNHHLQLQQANKTISMLADWLGYRSLVQRSHCTLAGFRF